MTAKTKWKERGTRALLVLSSLLIGCVLVFAAGEAYFRIRWNAGRHSAGPGWYVPHDQRGWALRPGDYTRFLPGVFREVHVSINSLGFRDREVSLRPSPGRPRITILGDSFGFGDSLNAEERFTEQLQALMDDSVEVVNVSVPGYGTGHEFLFIRELMDRGYEAGDKLVFVFFTNDVLDNMGLDYGDARRLPRLPAFGVGEDGEFVIVPPVAPAPTGPRPPPPRRSIPRRVCGWIRNRAFSRFLVERATSLAGRYPWVVSALERCGAHLVPNRTPAVIVGWYSDGWEERWGTTKDILRYVAHYDGFESTEVAVAFVPSSLQVERTIQILAERFSARDPRYAELLRDPDRPQRELREFCEENGVPFIDTTAALREASLESPAYYLREGHLNSFGSEQVARALHRWLLSEAAGGVGAADRGAE